MTRSHRACVPARVGLVGNPSDGYGGAVLTAVAGAWTAAATATPAADGVRVRNRTAGDARWASREALAGDAPAREPDAPHGIVVAALAALDAHLDAGLPAVDVEWSSTIPRSVGLAGSSAIAVAVIEAVAAVAGRQLDPRLVATIALDAEVVGMGIAAGWQDRMVQAHRGAVLVDAGDMTACVDGRAVPAVARVPGLAIDAVIGWSPQDREDSDVYHQALRGRVASPAVADGMRRLAVLARRAATCAEQGDIVGVRALVDASWAIRCATAPLHPRHAHLVEVVRAAGVVATSPGSGGSVVALPADRGEAEAARAALAGVDARAVSIALS